jgi:RNA polymerase sigma-70 factor (ECF subfamily)
MVMEQTRDQLYEELLVLRCQQGNAGAWDELVEHLQPRLWRYAQALVGEEEASWDVLQEAWLAILKGLRSLKETGAFRSWAHRIVSHKAADWLRKRSRQRLICREMADEAKLPARAPLALTDEMAVRMAVDMLPHASRALLALRYGNDLGISEIAAVLEVPEGTVKSRLHRAREALRDLLEAQNDGRS